MVRCRFQAAVARAVLRISITPRCKALHTEDAVVEEAAAYVTMRSTPTDT